ncbi:MAG: PIN domain-containing protein [Candidatus Bathyarchaeia archaeon]
MRLLLDTTYLLPAIGISIKELPKDVPIKLIQKGNRISICDISIFELSAKGAKYISEGTLSAERVTRGIRAIVYNDTIEVIPTHESALLLTAFKLRSMLNDFIDCLILSAAMNRCDVLLTEDKDIQDLKKNNEFNGLRKAINPKFKIQLLTKTLQPQR